MIGRKIAHYEIVEKIGEGGMGVVYKARDTHLGRFVAVKVLAGAMSAHPERKRRFVQEARLASSLNHPNIVTIYDILEEAGCDSIVMEYVSGRTLDDLIRKGATRFPEALKYAVQIADALAAAHGSGIVHRDLKPTNVIVTEGGLVKVLDFGLAKLIETEAHSEDSTTPGVAPTEEGTILGTVPYMSPEQVEGRSVDTRSDIFSFGSLLYEMVTGQRAFHGETRLALLAAILRSEPRPVHELARDVPPEVERVISHCLRKDPAKRFQHMADLKSLIEDIKEDSDSGRLQAVRGLPPPAKRRWLWAALAAAVVLASAGVAAWLSSLERSSVPPPRYTLFQLTRDSGLTTQPAISPDGKLVAYVSDRAEEDNPDIWVQQTGGGTPVRLTTSPAVDCQPVFSPSGAMIAYSSFGEKPGVFVVPALGGLGRLVAPGGMWPTFSPNGESLAYSVGFRWRRSAVYVVNLYGGEPRPLAPGLPWSYGASWAPEGENLLVEGSQRETPVTTETLDWWLVPANGGKPVATGLRKFLLAGEIRPLLDVSPMHDSRVVWEPRDHHVVFAAQHGGSADLWRLPLSPHSGEIGGQAEQLTSGAIAVRQPSVADDGRIVFSSGATTRHIWRVPMDANRGRVRGKLEPVTEGAAEHISPSVSSDGKRLLFMSNKSGGYEVWERDLATGDEKQLTATPGWENRPLMAPDGARVAFCRGASGSCSLRVLELATGREQELRARVNVAVAWSPQGERLYFVTTEPSILQSVELPTGRVTDVVRHRQYAVRPGSLSPDGRWISFRLVTEGDNQPVFIAPLRDGAALDERTWVRITDGPNDECWWSPDGSLLYFLSRRDGFRCVWAQKLDPDSKNPSGSPFGVLHLHGRRHVVGGLSFGPGMTRDGLYCGLRETTANIWVATPEK
jgi:serine/threonine protein kinase